MKCVVDCLSAPFLCRLGFHKWRNYGDEVEVFWEEPPLRIARNKYLSHNEERHSETVYEGRECKRCSIKLRRKFVTNSNGTLSCVGWETGSEDTDKE